MPMHASSPIRVTNLLQQQGPGPRAASRRSRMAFPDSSSAFSPSQHASSSSTSSSSPSTSASTIGSTPPPSPSLRLPIIPLPEPPKSGFPACAACRHQRRKCSPACPLAQYFPVEQRDRFTNAQRLFGVKNILRLMKVAGPERRDDVMKSIVYESDARAADPVHGAQGVQLALTEELRRTYAELNAVQEQLALCRLKQSMAPAPAPQQQQPPLGPEGFHPPVPAAGEGCCGPPLPVVVDPEDLGFNPLPQPWRPKLEENGNHVYAAPYAVDTAVEDYVLEEPAVTVAAAPAAPAAPPTAPAMSMEREGRAAAAAALPSGENLMPSSNFR